jgi:hypothetical protein
MKALFFAMILAATTWLQAAEFQPLNWGDLENGQKYELLSDIQLSDTVSLHKGEGFEFADIADGSGFIWLSFKNLQCADVQLKTEMILFNPEPEDQQNDKSIGLLQDENCMLSVYVETRFFYNKSIFKNP